MKNEYTPKEIATQYMKQYARHKTGDFDPSYETVFTASQMRMIFADIKSKPGSMGEFFGQVQAHVVHMANADSGGDPNRILDCVNRYCGAITSLLLSVSSELCRQLSQPAYVAPPFIIDDGFDDYKHPDENILNLDFELPDWSTLDSKPT